MSTYNWPYGNGGAGGEVMPGGNNFDVQYKFGEDFQGTDSFMTDPLGNVTCATLLLNGISPVAAFNSVLALKNGHLTIAQDTPPTVVVGAAAGTGGTASVTTATDAAGILNITTTPISTQIGILASVMFNATYAHQPIVTLFPANAVAAINTSVLGIYVTASVEGFVVYGAVADIGGHAYQWNYQVMDGGV